MNTKLSLKDKIFYGVGNFGYSVISQTITSFFIFFGTGVLKMPGILIGICVGISTLWDGLCDPIVGYFSDNFNFAIFGRRKGFMLIASILMAAINIVIWGIPVDTNIALKFIIILVSLVLIETFNTMYATPYNALGSEMCNSYHEKTTIQIYKTIFFLLGMILPSVLMYIFLRDTPQYPQGQLNPAGYRYISYVSSVVCVVCGLLCVFLCGALNKKGKKEKIFYKQTTSKLSLKSMFRTMFKNMKKCFLNKDCKVLILGYSIAMIAAGVLTSVGIHFFTYCFSYSSMQITIILLSLILGTIISQPLWLKLSKLQDKKPALLLGILIATLGIYLIMVIFITKNLLKSYSFYIILVSIFVCGIGSGALYSLPNSMFSDAIGLMDTLDKNTAAYFSCMTLAFNVSSSVALLVVGVMLDVIKFDSNSKVQPLSVQTGIAIILFVGVLASLIISYYIFSKYSITKKDVIKKDNKDEKYRQHYNR